MINNSKTLALLFLSFVLAFLPSTPSFGSDIQQKQVDTFLKKNRSNLLIQYQCNHPSNLKLCNIVCSSGGTKLIETSYVKTGYYAERLSKIDGSVTGFFLIIDTDDSLAARDVWATLQSQSSCYFEGMSPILR